MSPEVVTINGKVVTVLKHDAGRSVSDGGYGMDQFTLQGLHNEWPTGTEVSISFPAKLIVGHVTNTWTDSQYNLTHLRVYRT